MVVFACTRFHDYVYGRPVTTETDHQPLVTILNKPLHSDPVHLQKMLMCLQRFNIHILYKKGKELYLAEMLSRAYVEPSSNDQPIGEDEYEVITVMPVTSRRLTQLQQHTEDDDTFQRLTKVMINGWPRSIFVSVK